jgi:hypothetical protein
MNPQMSARISTELPDIKRTPKWIVVSLGKEHQRRAVFPLSCFLAALRQLSAQCSRLANTQNVL